MVYISTPLERTKFVEGIRTDLKTRNKGAFAVITGEVGSGKSYCALRLAEAIDENFNLDNVAVGKTSEFITLLEKAFNGEIAQGSVLILDESGVGISAREWQSAQNRILGLVFQVIRKMGLFILLVLPTLSMLDINARRVMAYYIHSQYIDYEKELAVFKIYQTSYDDWSNKLYRRTVKDEGTKVVAWCVSLPQRIDLAAYERKKDELIRWLIERSKVTCASMEVIPIHKPTAVQIEEDIMSGLPIVDIAKKHNRAIRNISDIKYKLIKAGAVKE